MVVVAQLVRAPDCGSGGRRFEPGLPPKSRINVGIFVFHLFAFESFQFHHFSFSADCSFAGVSAK